MENIKNVKHLNLEKWKNSFEEKDKQTVRKGILLGIGLEKKNGFKQTEGEQL